MKKLNPKKYTGFVLSLLAIIAAMLFRQISFHTDGFIEWLSGILRSVIYIALFSAWGFSVLRRITQPQVRRYLTFIPALMVFWITVRAIRYVFAEDPTVMRLLWYLYYLPMQFIPCLSVFVAMSLGKPEKFRLPKWTALLYIPTAALLLLVLTNDFHQLVFDFPDDADVWINDYRYAVGYYFVICFIYTAALKRLWKPAFITFTMFG